jgi:hypothetical protein
MHTCVHVTCACMSNRPETTIKPEMVTTTRRKSSETSTVRTHPSDSAPNKDSKLTVMIRIFIMS